MNKESGPFALQAISILPQNQVWRPPNKIRAKVIGLAKHDNKLLVFEVLDDQGNLKGWCPIGGGIEFGEKAEEALIREINELRKEIKYLQESQARLISKVISLFYLCACDFNFIVVT